MSWLSAPKPRLVLGTYGPIFSRLELGPSEVFAHTRVVGTSGAGKSRFVASLLLQLLNQGVGFALVDPHSDLTRDILGSLIDTGFFQNEDAYRRLLYVQFGRQDSYVPFNVLRGPYEHHATARHVVEACERVWPALGDGAAPLFSTITLHGVYVLAENDLPLVCLSRLLTDRDYRNGLLRNVSDPDVVSFFRDRFDRWGRETPLMLESTLRRLSILSFTPALKFALGQQQNLLDFRQLMDSGTSVLFDLGGLDPESQRLLGCLLTVGFETAALSRADVPERLRRPFILALDEFSMFSATSEEALSRMLSLTRKFCLYALMVHQTISQNSERLEGALQNCSNLAFRLGTRDSELMARHFARVNPLLVKHEVPDETQQGRTHPVYYPLQEQLAAVAQELEDLKPREAYIKVNGTTKKFRSLGFPDPKCSEDELHRVMETYAQNLLVSGSELAVPGAADPLPAVGEVVFRREPLHTAGDD